MALTIHMVANAHLDPVWLWPWQTGADEALATCRSACDRAGGLGPPCAAGAAGPLAIAIGGGDIQRLIEAVEGTPAIEAVAQALLDFRDMTGILQLHAETGLFCA